MSGRKRLWLALSLLAVASLIVGSAHFYLARRLFLEPGWPEPWGGVGALAVALLGASMALVPLAERLVGPTRARWLAMPGSLWMGIGFLLLVSVGASDLVLVLMGSSGGEVTRGRALLCLGLVAVVAVVAVRTALRPPAVRRVDVGISRWPAALDGFRIVQISDLHIGPLRGRDFADDVARRVLALEPDLVAVTGDLVDGDVAHLADEVAPIAQLAAPHGVFFVTGNHDHLSGAAAWVERVRSLGLRVLRNERVVIGDGADSFDLVGVDDHRAGFIGQGREDLDAALAGRDPARPAVLLAHDPTTWKVARRRDVDLQLSGHTHGGQIWPFALLVRLVVPWVAGHYREGRAQLYVSRGTGFWGPPLRLFAPAEITEIAISRS